MQIRSNLVLEPVTVCTPTLGKNYFIAFFFSFTSLILSDSDILPPH